MSRQTFTIPGKLPSLNDLIGAMNHNRYSGAKLKRDTQHFIAIYALALRPIKTPATLHIAWYEKNARRDLDNVQSATKYVLDALVAIGKLEDDSPRHITAISHENHVDRANPRVVVTITEEETAA